MMTCLNAAKTQEANTTEVETTTEESRTCNWSIIAGEGTKLRVAWSGNAPANSDVTVEAEKVSDDPHCPDVQVAAETKFAEESVELEVCPNVQYKVSVHLQCSTSEASRTVWTPPEPPPDVTVGNVSNTSFSVSWSTPSGSGPIVLYSVRITDSDDADFSSADSTSTGTEVVRLHPYSVYHVRVAAQNPDFRGRYSERKRVETKPGIPDAPTHLRETVVGNTTVGLEWDEPTPTAGPIVGYRVRWQKESGDSAEEEDTSSNRTDHVVEHLSPFVVYAFRVSAETEAGRGQWSEELTLRTEVGTPLAPENLTETSVQNTSVALRWDEPAVSTGPVLKYRVWWRNSTGQGTVVTPSNATALTVEPLVPYVEYIFRVSAETAAGPGAWSRERKVRTQEGVPFAPDNLRETSVHNTSVLLTWDEPPLSTGPILRYRVRWRNSTAEGTVVTQSNETRCTVGGLAPYTEYTFQVSAETKAGPGAGSGKLTIRTRPGIPGAPRNLKESSVTNTSVTLQWDEPAVRVGPILRYRVAVRNAGARQEHDTPDNVTSYTVGHLAPFVRYRFRVSAVTDAGEGTWSDEVDVLTDVGVPHAPTGVSLSDVTNTTVEVGWAAPSVSTGPIEKYRIRWKNSSGEGEEDTALPTPTSHTLRRLTPYAEYAFKVLAMTAAGPGEWSEEVKTRTGVGVPHAVRNFSVVEVRNVSIDVGWEAPGISTGPVLGYRVSWRNSSSSGEEDTSSKNTFHTLEHLTPYVLYDLRVAALTEAGPGQWSPKLTVRTDIGVPHPPTRLTVHNITNTTVLISWSEPEPTTGPVQSYVVQWRSSRDSGTGDASEERFLATGLLPFLNYSFYVSAVTEAGRGEWSESIHVHTDIGVPSAPRELRFEPDHVTNVSVSLSWNRPDFPNAPVLDYRLTCRRTLLQEDVDKIVETFRVSALNESVTFVLRNLLPYTYYSFRVSAGSSAGRGPETEKLTVKTKIGVPLPAKILDVRPSDRRSAVVYWRTEGPYPGPVDFLLEAWQHPGPCSSREEEFVARQQSGSQRAEEWRTEHATEIDDLSPYGVYHFKISLKTSVMDDGMYSGKSDIIRIAPEASGRPSNVRAECVGSPTDLRISWEPPDPPTGLITSYRIRYGLERLNLTRVVHVQNMCRGQSHVLSGLRPERRYLVSVSARVENVSEEGEEGRAGRVCTLPSGIPFLGDTSGLSAEGSGPHSLKLEWTRDVFSDYMGTIVRYAVIVGRMHSLGNSTGGKRADPLPPWFNFSSGSSRFYQATPPDWNPFDPEAFDPLECQVSADDVNRTLLRCFVGLQQDCPDNETTYCNGPVEPDTPYELKIRAFTRGGFNETDRLYARSGSVPTPSVAGRVVVVIVVLLLLSSLAAGLYVTRKRGHLDRWIALVRAHVTRKEEQSPSEDCGMMPMEECSKPKPVRTRDFSEHVRIMMSDSHLKFSLEFEKLKRDSPHLPCSVAETEDNRPKNRWMNIFPFDHSRVKLLPLCDEPGSDFINANYVPGFSSRREYIATQGPLPHTLEDFWRMVWEQSVHVIVMLTQCVERGKRKCEQYWPQSGEAQYFGDLRISTVAESMLSSYVIRLLHLQLGSYERHVKQMHFTHWPDFGCPESPEDLINFVHAVRDHLPRVAPGPILVHCSAGVGRTGTFIAVDRLMLQLRNAPDTGGDDTVDVYGTVLDLRRHRTNMVQTEDQYIYIHLCVRQLIEERHRPRQNDSRENIYSNVATEAGQKSVKPTAPELSP